MIATKDDPDHIEMMLGVGDQGVRKMIHAEDILFVEAKQKKVMATTKEGTWQIRETITNLEDKLDQASFIRVHKAFLVNIFKIAEIVPWFKGAYLLKFRDTAHKVPVSRTYAPELKSRLNW
jgi:DNA-binding LytR/AlgR family response regulator